MSMNFTCLGSLSVTRDYFLQDGVCRFCWKTNSSKELNPDRVNSLKNPFLYKIQHCLDIDITRDESESYPNKVCGECFIKIEQFYDFKVFCQDSNRNLHKIFKSTGNKSCVTRRSCNNLIKLEKYESDEDLTDHPPSTETIKESSNNINCSNQEPKPVPVASSSSQQATHTRKGLKTVKQTYNNTQRLYSEKETKINYKNCKQVSSSKKPPSNCRYNWKRTSNYCTICCAIFPDKDIFNMHNSQLHGIEIDGKYKCFGCEKMYDNRQARAQHERHRCPELQNGFKCSICNRLVPTRGTYEKHMKDHRENKEISLPEDDCIFKCSICCEKFTIKKELDRHLKGHAPEKKYICETCGKVFNRRTYLIMHIATHTRETKYVCPLCGYRTISKSSFNVHLRKHTGERPFACDLCPQRCVSSSNLRAHRRRHLGYKKFQCNICDKKFGYKDSLENHIATAHERGPRVQCTHAHCGAEYGTRHALRKHMRVKHNACTEHTREHHSQPTHHQHNSNSTHTSENNQPLSTNIDNDKLQPNRHEPPIEGQSTASTASTATQPEHKQFGLEMESVRVDLKHGQQFVIVLQ